MFKVTNYFRFFDWEKLLLAGLLSFGVMTAELQAQHKTPTTKVSLGKAKDVVAAFEENSNARGSKSSEKVLNHKTADGSKLTLRLNKSSRNGGQTRYMGYVNGSDKETFDLTLENGKLKGHVIQYDKRKAYEYSSDAAGQASLKEVDINSVVCMDYHAASGIITSGALPASFTRTPVVNSPAVFALQSNPGAPGVLFLDFDGHYMASSNWFGGASFKAAPSYYNDDEIRTVFQSVSEDYSPFNINVTTDSAAYAAVPYGRKIRILMTPSSAWNTAGNGGIAGFNTFSSTQAEVGWVFTDRMYTARDAAEAASHEAGHTFNLSHDGKYAGGGDNEYYGGQGNWAPIMGVSYGKEYAQFSKGEYSNPSNTQDDLIMIASAGGGIGLKADDHANVQASATNLVINSGKFSSKGLISTSADIDVFKLILTSAASLDLNVLVPVITSNLKAKVDLYNSSGTIIQTGVSVNGKSVSIATASLPAGTYYVQVDGVGQDDPLTNGFSDYASLGQYEVTGTLITPATAGCTATAWNSATAYSTNAVVSYNGNQYTAKWWTQNNQPDLNTGEGKPWLLNGPCGISNTAPVVTLTKPVNNFVSQQSQDLLLQATATDNSGVAYVEFFVNDVLVAKVVNAPYEYSYNIGSAATTYLVKARAVDNNGAEAFSAVSSIRVNANPWVSLASPANNTILTFGSSVLVGFTPYDADGTVAKAEIYVDNVKVGEKTASPWDFTIPSVPLATADDYVLPITVVTTDNDGGKGQQTIKTKVKVSGQNSLPIISVIVPYEQNTKIPLGGSLNFEVDAIDVDGDIQKVELFLNGIKYGEYTQAPYGRVMSPPVSGSTSVFTAVATDSDGGQSSKDVTVIVTNNPIISFVEPLPQSLHQIGSDINVKLNAYDIDGQIERIEYYYQAELVGTKTSAPWEFVMPSVPAPISGGPDSILVLVAVAFDNDGLARGATCPIRVTKKPVGNTAPVVTITSPTSSTKYLIGGSVTVSANVTDAEGDAISKVEIYSPQLGAGSTVTIVPPAAFTTTYSNLPSANPQIGGLTFVVKAYDSKGAVGTQDIFVYQDKVPTVSITSPSNNGVVNEGSVTIAATAFDDGNVTRVDFLNQIGAVIATDNSAPYEYAVNLAGGNYTYRAVAYDNAGQYSTTANVTFRVNKLPTASMTAPANNSVVQAGYTLLLTANASDLDGTVAKVEFYSNYDGKLGEDNIAPYEWTIPSTTKGNYQYFAKVTDNDGGENYSTSVYVLVNAAPTATFASPVANDKYAQTGTMQINVNTADIDGNVTKVEYFLGNLNPSNKVGEKTASPFNLAVASVPLPTTGQNILPVIVKVTDNNGGITVADTYVQSVVNTAPAATITSPVNNLSTSATSVAINVTATDAEVNTPVTKVEFLNNAGTVVNTTTTSPFTYALTGLTPGSYTYKARSYDALNAVSSVATVTFTITGTTCTATPWNSTTAYSTNAIVSYNGNRYKANYWSQGATPDTHSGAYQEWTNQGVCNSRQEQGVSLANTSLQVYPNPVADNASVVFDLGGAEVVSVVVYNTVGEKIVTVFNGQLEAGTHRYELNTQSFASGVYIVRLAGSNGSQKVTIVKE